MELRSQRSVGLLLLANGRNPMGPGWQLLQCWSALRYLLQTPADFGVL